MKDWPSLLPCRILNRRLPVVAPAVILMMAPVEPAALAHLVEPLVVTMGLAAVEAVASDVPLEPLFLAAAALSQ